MLLLVLVLVGSFSAINILLVVEVIKIKHDIKGMK